MRTLILSLTFVSLALGAPACGSKKPPANKKKPPAAQVKPFVASAQAAARHWLPPNRDGSKFAVDTARVYDRKTVFELLNGGAEVFLDAGMQTLLHARLKDAAGKFTACEVQVMQLATPAQAKALLAKEKPPKAKPVKLGDQGWADKGSVMFVKGSQMVSVGVQPAGKLKWAPLSEIARRVASTPDARW
jgi:hypothetical protein